MANFEVTACVVCDLVRRDESGKDLLVGVYASDIVATNLPFVMAVFGIWIRIKPGATSYNGFTLEIRKPNGDVLTAAGGDIGFESPDSFCAIPFQFGNVPFDTEGRYTIVLGPEGDRREIGSFNLVKGMPARSN